MTNEERLSAIEIKLAILESKAERAENDVRVYAPLVTDNVRIFERLDGAQNAITGLRENVRKNEKSMREARVWAEAEFDSRDRRDSERADKERTFRWTNYLAIGTLLLTAGGLIIGILTVAASH